MKQRFGRETLQAEIGVVSVLWIALILCAPVPLVQAQIGGRTAADGPFVLDDVEDLDLTADGVMRNWVSDYIEPTGSILTTLRLSGSGLTLAQGQTPIGAFRARIPEVLGYISGGFGVPMPGEAGASSADHPGNITSFNFLSFEACFQPTFSGQFFEVILETYPGPTYPKIYWRFSPAVGTTFRTVKIDLKAPSLIENSGGKSLVELLSQTRFLYFYCYAKQVPTGTTLDFHIDDIRLLGATPSAVRRWWMY